MSGSYDDAYAKDLFGKGLLVETAEYCRPFAEAGIPAAQCTLGVLYQLGVGVDADPHAAERLFLKSAEQGLSVAWCNLGTLYASGALGSADHDKAGVCYRRAADLGGPSNADYLD